MNEERGSILAAAAGVLMAGAIACGGGDDDYLARAKLVDQLGTEFGTLELRQARGSSEVTMELSITTTSTHATPGEHGLHVHATGVCTPPSFQSAQGHWNPAGAMHGNPAAGAHHGGDLGNFTIGPDHTAKVTLKSSEMALSLGQPSSILGLAVIVHANPDDFVTQMPPGNAGPRVACGVIVPLPN